MARLRWAAPLAVILAIVAWHNTVLFNHYLGHAYAFHDLGVITDWFTNGVHHGRPFWITSYELNHLSVHWTPALLLWMPFYLFTESSYVLPLLGTLAFGAALFLGHLILMRLLGPLGESRLGLLVSCTSLGVIGLNPYWKAVLEATHIEVLYAPFLLGLVYLLLCSRRLWPQLVLLVLALGVREEAGLYLAVQLMALLVLPASAFPGQKRPTRRVLAFAGAGLAHVAFAMKVVFPLLFGIQENNLDRGWARWGSSWGEVMLAWATHPLAVLGEIWHSGFVPLNGTFYFLAWLQPVAGFLVNLPGALLYVSDAPSKKFLWFYDASFLLPGMMLGFELGVVRLAGWLRRAALHVPHPERAGPIAAVILAALAWAYPLLNLERVPTGRHGYRRMDETSGKRELRAIAALLDRCPAISDVATDFNHFVFLPNRLTRRLPYQWERANAVFRFEDANPTAIGFEAGGAGALWATLEGNAGFSTLEQDGVLRAYVRADIACR